MAQSRKKTPEKQSRAKRHRNKPCHKLTDIDKLVRNLSELNKLQTSILKRLERHLAELM